MMACPNCDHTMQQICPARPSLGPHRTEGPIWWCPQCGTLTSPHGEHPDLVDTPSWSMGVDAEAFKKIVKRNPETLALLEKEPPCQTPPQM